MEGGQHGSFHWQRYQESNASLQLVVFVYLADKGEVKEEDLGVKDSGPGPEAPPSGLGPGPGLACAQCRTIFMTEEARALKPREKTLKLDGSFPSFPSRWFCCLLRFLISESVLKTTIIFMFYKVHI